VRRLHAAHLAQQQIEPATQAPETLSKVRGIRREIDGSTRRWLWIGGIAVLLVLAVLLYLKMRPAERVLNVQPAELSFAYQRGGALPKPGAIAVRGKPADGVCTVATSDPWFTVSPAQLTGDGSIKVEVNPANLVPGEYSGFATVSAKDAPLSPASVRVHMRVTEEPAAPKTGAPKTALPGGNNVPETPPKDPKRNGAAAKVTTDPRIRTRVNPADGLTYVFIPPGASTMGCSPGDSQCVDLEEPPHAEQIANGFWLGQTEVTQAAWKKVKNYDPSHFKGDQLPVEEVEWAQAGDYCKAIGGRLPTEKEWEYAARAGAAGARYGVLDAVAWYYANSGGTTHPVGLKQANAFGLYDMLGNVLEWTADDYSSGLKVVRGGSWNNSSGFVRASVRVRYVPAGRENVIGFRCVGEFR
jgi:Sulfatase-modifying factor enzyme 1